MAALLLRDVVKRYESGTAIDHVSLDIADGEFVCLLGPSGCGKSTLLNIIAGLIPHDGGAVLMNGSDVTGLAPKDRKIAMVFQDYALYPHMTVAENLGFPLKAARLESAEIASRVARVSTALGIDDLLERLPRDLSGGQRQRVALGRATVRTPSVFLMDEPLSNLDAKLRVQMRAELKMLCQRLRTTTVYVTHDQSEAMTLSDRIAVLDRGVVQQFDAPLTVYRSPANMFVANFMGSMPMNMLPGTLSAGSAGMRFEGEDAAIRISAPAFAGMSSRRAVMGVRPEDLYVGPSSDELCLEVDVEMTEHLGSDQYVYSRLGASQLIFRTEADRDMRPGKVRVGAKAEALHFFDRSSGVRLDLQTGPVS